MIRRSRTGRRRIFDDSGITLVELLVAVILLGIIGAMVSSLFLSASRTLSQAQRLTGNTREASNGMNEISRVIRAATENPVSGQSLNDPAFVSPTTAPLTGEAITLYAYVNLTSATQQPVKIRLALDSSRRLVETVWPATLLSPGFYSFTTTAPTSTRIMAGTVAPQAAGGPALFTYLLSDGTVLPVPATGTFTVAQLRTIAAVTVNLTVQSSATNSQSAVTLQNTVGMPNLPLTRTGS